MKLLLARVEYNGGKRVTTWRLSCKEEIIIYDLVKHRFINILLRIMNMNLVLGILLSIIIISCAVDTETFLSGFVT